MKANSKAILASVLALALSACEGVFTASLLSFLQRDPANLSPEQRIAWAEQALASGDPQAMAEAYALIRGDPGQAYLAASLAAELSGVPGAIAEALADWETVSGYDSAQLEAYLDDFFDSIDSTYAVAAGDHYQAALEQDPSQLSGQDVIIGALCLAYGAVAGDGDFGSATPEEQAEVTAFIDAGLAALPADDPSRDLLTQILDFVNSGLF